MYGIEFKNQTFYSQKFDKSHLNSYNICVVYLYRYNKMTDFENIEFSKNSEMIEIDEDLEGLKNNVDKNPMEKDFWWVTLNRTKKYEVPWVKESERLTKNKWVVYYDKSLVITKDWRSWIDSHKETFYSQKRMPWKTLNIPWRHVAEDGTVRDGEWYIVLAAPLKIYPRGTRIMTTLWPGKVYDTWWMRGKWIDLYVNR